MPVELDKIRSNSIPRCADCGIPITLDNDSGWEAIVGWGCVTQPLCAWCDARRQMEADLRPKQVG